MTGRFMADVGQEFTQQEAIARRRQVLVGEVEAGTVRVAENHLPGSNTSYPCSRRNRPTASWNPHG
jgi:hypothetical protein